MIQWGGVPAGGTVWRAWDGEVVVYVQGTGEVHRLSRVAAAIWLAIGEADDTHLSAAEWFDKLFGDSGDEADLADSEHGGLEDFVGHLCDLERRGLLVKRGN